AELAPGHAHQGGEDVEAHHGLAHHAARRVASRPPRDGGHAHAALVGRVLARPEGPGRAGVELALREPGAVVAGEEGGRAASRGRGWPSPPPPRSTPAPPPRPRRPLPPTFR